jgi:hypothetical protein
MSIIFIMPMPATTNETEATAASMIAMMLDDASCAAKSSCKLRIVKSSASTACR